ncbi:hypothetical protein Pla22_11080 [Rubripirellula amarantea]|uniref:Tetratricopeptide repeat protein n=1 Tax=Rubripirellula amarantea TaxID=2527999 RepID=A0A5C5WTH4_9BACT|nr:hypothetical protein [Rubripirellula amarantea]TWT53479.1 hypothetical protein Pla22_11080 [Rubripirellula amarantea]
MMESVHYVTCLWPGLPELWWRGRLTALPAAIAFALAVNFVLVTRFIYPQWLPSGLATMAFWIGLVAWGFLIYRNIRELPEIVFPRAVSEEPDVFPAAQQAYLKGNWKVTEQLLNDVLAIEHRDPPALLLLAGVYRITERYESAEMLMKEIGRLEVADGWFLEVAAEQQRLEQAIEKQRLAESEMADEKETESDREESEREKPDHRAPQQDTSAADLTESGDDQQGMAA